MKATPDKNPTKTVSRHAGLAQVPHHWSPPVACRRHPRRPSGMLWARWAMSSEGPMLNRSLQRCRRRGRCTSRGMPLPSPGSHLAWEQVRRDGAYSLFTCLGASKAGRGVSFVLPFGCVPQTEELTRHMAQELSSSSPTFMPLQHPSPGHPWSP